MQINYPLILDGATGTELQKRGFDGSMCTEQWVIENPWAITEVQKNYEIAGSNVVYAPTFSANRVKLEENGLFNKVDEYNKKLVAISRQAVGENTFVAGDIAPTGLFLAPTGDTPFDELVEIYKEQVTALEEAGVDYFAIETMMTVADARAAVIAIKEVSERPVFVTFTCDKSGKTLTGSDVKAVLVMMQGLGVDAFGLNCSNGPEEILHQCQEMRDYAEIPLIAKPNAGQPEFIDGKAVYSLSAEDFTKYYEDFIEAGVSIFGGCCGSTDAHIRALSEKVKETGGKYNKPVAKYKDMLNLATEKQAFILPVDAKVEKILDMDENFETNLEEIIGEVEGKLLGIRIREEGDLDNLSDFQYAISMPVCFMCEDEALLEESLKRFQGRAMYKGNLPEEVLLRLAKKYGLEF